MIIEYQCLESLTHESNNTEEYIVQRIAMDVLDKLIVVQKSPHFDFGLGIMAVELNYTTREGDRVDYLRTVSERGGPRDGEHALPNVLKCTHLRNSMMNLASPHPSTHYCAAQLQLHTTWVQTGSSCSRSHARRRRFFVVIERSDRPESASA